MNLHLGCDPEIFVGDDTGPKSIVGRIGGTKAVPLPMPIGEGFAVQEDNVALEYNIPASGSRQLFIENVSKGRDFLAQVMQDMQGLSLLKASALSFPPEELQTREAQTFGCDPDFNAWTLRPNPRPRARDRNLRSCGGHVHIGYVGTKYEMIDLPTAIKACDLHLGVPSVLMDNGLLRKELYGKAGAYRKKSYGGEYRTLSNYWIFDEQKIGWVYQAVENALEAVLNGYNPDEDGELIQTCINTNDIAMASGLIAKHSLYMV